MRAPFNTTATIYDGPTTATPGFPRLVDIPVRLVSDQYFVDFSAPLNASDAYFTQEVDEPRASVNTDMGGGIWQFDFGKADRVEFAVLPGLLFVIVRTELCTWPVAGAPYWRSSIVETEPPPIGCEAAYSEEYVITDDNDASTHVLLRTSPTTWEGDGYVLTAQTEWVNPDICLSRWTITHDGFEWINVNWDGGADGIFYDYVGSLFPIHVDRP